MILLYIPCLLISCNGFMAILARNSDDRLTLGIYGISRYLLMTLASFPWEESQQGAAFGGHKIVTCLIAKLPGF